MALTRKTQATVPPTELARLRATLAPYGSTLWEPEGESILVLRVPGNEPDLVNDLEQAAEYVGPELAEASCLLLLGNTGSTVIPPDVLLPIVAQRRRRDEEFASALRPAMKPGTHRVMPAPGDARRNPRLLVRLARPNVAATEDSDWDHLAHALGQELSQGNTLDVPSLEPALAGVRFVHVLADHDDLRLDADLVLPDLDRRWGEDQERRRLAAEAAEKLSPRTAKATLEPAPRSGHAPSTLDDRAAARSGSTAPRSVDPLAAFDAAIARERSDRMGIRRRAPMGTATAPLRRASSVTWEARDEPRVPFDLDAELANFRTARDARIRSPVETDPRHRRVQQEVDALVGAPVERPTRAARTPPTSSSSVGAGASLRDIDAILGPRGPTPTAITPAAPAKPDAPGIAELRSKLEAAGYQLARSAPEGTALAAERAQHPARLVAFAPARLDRETAIKVLDFVRRSDADLGLVVCADADQDAKERFIATRGRWVAPDAVGSLVLG